MGNKGLGTRGRKPGLRTNVPVMQDPDELIPTRQSLLERLKDVADDESWRMFFEIYWRLIYYTGIKAGLNETEAEDLVQETVVSVFKSIESFNYAREHGSFKSWLLKLTRWRILDQFRKRQQNLTTLGAAGIEKLPEPPSLNKLDLAWDEEWATNLLQAAIERLKKKVDPKHWQLFDLYTFKQWPVRRIASALSVSAAQVYIVKHRLKKQLRKEIHELEKGGVL
jgi:RNA polymerase sigma factor (sigma-70 family)